MVGISFMVSSFVLFLFHIYLGRSLGPEGYGNFAYIITVGNFLALLYMIGLQPAIINILSPKSGEDRKECLTTTFVMILILFIGVSIVYLVVQDFIASLFELDPALVGYSVLFAITFAGYNLTQAFVQALQDMKSVSMMRLISSILFVLIFFATQYWAPDLIDYRRAVEYKAVGLAVAVLSVIVVALRKEISLRLFNPKVTGVLFHYALYGFLLQLCAAFILEFTKVILNKNFDAATIGLYQVYYVSSVSIAQMIITSIVTVYFPTISKSNNKAAIIETLASYEKYLPLLFIPSYLLSYVFFRMYGPQYRLDLWTLGLFNGYVIFFFVSSIYSRTLESFGVYGVRSSFMVSLSGSILTITLSLLTIPAYGIDGAIFTMATTKLVFFLVFRVILRKKVRASAR